MIDDCIFECTTSSLCLFFGFVLFFSFYRLDNRHQHLAHSSTPTHKPMSFNSPVSMAVNVSIFLFIQLWCKYINVGFFLNRISVAVLFHQVLINLHP